MANVYATKNGNWSDVTVWNTGALPTSADDVFSNTYTVTIDQNVTVLSLRNTAASPIVAGGGFVCSTTQTINLTATIGIVGTGNFHVLLWNGGIGVTTTVNAVNIDAYNANFYAISVAGLGILNINSNIRHTLSNSNTHAVNISSNCTVNVVGDLISISSGGASSLSGSCIRITSGTLNFLGNYPAGQQGLAQGIRNDTGAAIINITGNLTNSSISAPTGGGLTSQRPIISSNQASTLNVTGNLYGYCIGLTSNSYFNHIGILESFVGRCIESTAATAINIMTGPFISSDTGVVPFSVFRMHYFRTLGSYFEFRDETTNGALPPAAAAPATRLVSPDTAVDAPIPADVRDGISYALGTFTGTCKVPHPDSVAKDVPVDNTVGNAVLTADAIWDYATALITDPDSIGARLKNVATVDTTGEQLEALL